MAISTYAELLTALENWSGDADTLDSRNPEFVALCESRHALDLRIRPMEKQSELKAFRTYSADTVGGTANAITLTLSETLALTTGLTVSWTASATNTGAVTLNPNSLGATALNKDDGTTALDAGDIHSGEDYRAYYDGTRFRLIEPGQVPLPTRFVAQKRLYIPGDPNKPLEYLPPFEFHSRRLSTETGTPSHFTIENEYIRFGPIPDADHIVKILWWQRFAALSGSATNWLLTNHPGAYLYGSMLELSNFLEDDEGVVKYGKLYQDIVDRIASADIRDRHGSGPLRQRTNVTRS